MAFDRLVRDRRGQAIWVGFVLLLGIAVVAFAGYQAYQVPQQNAAAEVEHSETVSGQLQELRNAVYNARTGGGVQSTRIQLGAQFPQRLFALNPPRPSGELRTVEPAEPISFDNAAVDEDRYTRPIGEIEADILDTEHDTRFIEYQPTYREFQEAPTARYEHSLLYNAFPAGPIELTEQGLVDGDRINLLLVTGEYSEAGSEQVVVDPEITSGPTEVTVEPETEGEPITLRVPTANPEVWEQRVAEEDEVTVADSSPDWVELELEREEYTLRMATVSLAGEESTPEFDIQPLQPEAGPGVGTPDTYEVQWQLDQMAEQQGVERDDDRLVVDTEVETVGGLVEVRERDADVIDEATVDFGTNDADVVGVDPGTEVTDSDGLAEIELPIDGAVDDTTRVFAASGDTVAPLDIELIENLLGLFFAGNEQTDGENVEFDIENVGAERTITAVAVETDLAERFNRANNDPEITINGGELDTPGAGPQALAADGTEHELDDDAVLADGDTVTVEIGDFEEGGFDGFDGLTHTEDQTEADITVTLVTDNGDFEFYFIDE